MQFNNKFFKIYIISGEESGENIIYNILKSLTIHQKINLYGIGSKRMHDLGMKPLFSYTELSMMGLLEILPKIPKVFSLINKVTRDIKEVKPDLIISVDAPDFSFRVLKKVKKQIPQMKNLHIVAPTVWAWKPGRAKKISNFIDNLFVLYPFEEKYFIKYKINTFFIGHPILDISKHRIKSKVDGKLISIYPGSRKKEILYHLDKILLFLTKYKNSSNFNFVIVAVDKHYSLINKIYAKYKSKLTIRLVKSSKHKQDIFNKSFFSIAVSGTISLELAINLIPMIIVYRLNQISYLILKQIVKTKYVSIVNILFKKKVIPELIQGDFNEKNMSNQLDDYLLKKNNYNQQVVYFKKAINLLNKTGTNVSSNAASIILKILKNSLKR